ncbi:MAG: LCP family protein [Candidatus Moranbacteria bacterium]|nr:LCP family protein [Candidatus Moranbacteria bacterium]
MAYIPTVQPSGEGDEKKENGNNKKMDILKPKILNNKSNIKEEVPMNKNTSSQPKWYKKKWFITTVIIVAIIAIGGGVFAWKTGSVIGKISKGSLFTSIVKSLPGVDNTLKGEKDGRINILLLGMRGENIPGGGLLADTIMLVSIKPAENKVSMISVPRDLQVTIPGTQDRQKINAVHFYGENDGKKQGLEYMKQIIGEVTGLPIHYAVSINFEGFKKLIDAVGGIEITLDQPFEEPLQFDEAKVCDPNVFTEKTGKFEYKKDDKGRIVAAYPLCTNPDKECNGDFRLPAGKQTLNGSQALCLARSRVTTNDFERAKRQQLILQLLKDKLTSIGTLADFGKMNGILDSLGDNVRSDMAAWEMKDFFELYQKMSNIQFYQRVLENTSEGLLYNPENAPKEVGYILLPIGDNYDKIREMAKNIFDLPTQSDIKT